MMLSVSMIVRNEEKHLARCLASIKDLADEIVVLDTGSTDRTLEIASAFGAKIFHTPWQNDFSAARNASLARCSGDWILVLDADEAIDPTDHQIIRNLISQEREPAYRFCCRNYLASATQTILDAAPAANESHYTIGREHQYYVDYVIHTRLFRRFSDIHFSGRIHEVVDSYFESRGMPVGISTAVIHHFGKLDSEREPYKRDFYLRLCEEEVNARPDNYLALFNLILQSQSAKKWELCLDAVQKFVALRQTIPALVRIAAGMSYLNLGDRAAAENSLEEALKLEPANANALALKANCLVARHSYQEACECLEAAIAAQRSYAVPRVNLAEVKIMMGKFEDARQTLLSGISETPTEEIFYTKLVQLDFQLGQLKQAAASAALAISNFPSGGDGLWHRVRAMSLLQDGDRSEALCIVESGCRAFPKNEALLRLKALCMQESVD